MDAALTTLTLSLFDAKGRKHSVVVRLPADYPFTPPTLTASLPGLALELQWKAPSDTALHRTQAQAQTYVQTQVQAHRHRGRLACWVKRIRSISSIALDSCFGSYGLRVVRTTTRGTSSNGCCSTNNFMYPKSLDWSTCTPFVELGVPTLSTQLRVPTSSAELGGGDS